MLNLFGHANLFRQREFVSKIGVNDRREKSSPFVVRNAERREIIGLSPLDLGVTRSWGQLRQKRSTVSKCSGLRSLLFVGN